MTVIVLLFAICILISWAIEQKPADRMYVQPLRIYSIVYFGFPILLFFLSQRFLRSIDYQKPMTGIALWCVFVKMITVVAAVALFPGMVFLFIFLLRGEMVVRE